jgi:hypothetical protein
MTKRESETERRRAQLLARSARLREDIVRTGAGVAGRLGGAERSMKVARAITSTPVLLAAGAALLAYAGPARAITLIGRGLAGVNLLRRVLSALGPSGAAPGAAREPIRRERSDGGQ